MSDFHYDVDGCHGVLVTRQRQPHWMSIGAFSGMAFVYASSVGLGLGRLGLATVIGMAVTGVFAVFMNGVPARVERGFRVDGPFLVLEHPGPLRHHGELDAQGWVRLDLRGARVHASEVGVTVELAHHERVELFWDGASEESAGMLADALRGVASRAAHGSEDEIPPALRDLSRERREA